MKKKYALVVRGWRDEWVFNIEADPQSVEDWRADGLCVEEIVNEIPQIWVMLGLPVEWWCQLQDMGIIPLICGENEQEVKR